MFFINLVVKGWLEIFFLLSFQHLILRLLFDLKNRLTFTDWSFEDVKFILTLILNGNRLFEEAFKGFYILSFSHRIVPLGLRVVSILAVVLLSSKELRVFTLAIVV